MFGSIICRRSCSACLGESPCQLPALLLFQRSSLSWNQWEEVFFHRMLCLSSAHWLGSCSIILGFAWDTSVCATLPALPRDNQMGKGWWITTRSRTKRCCSSQPWYLRGIYFVLKVTPVSHGIYFGFLLLLQSNKESTLTLFCLFSCFYACGFPSSNCLVQFPAFKEEIAHLHVIWNFSLTHLFVMFFS